MGYLLKEALKTLCGVNQWSYAVFWKFGCQNPKLLIWEECYYELALLSGNENLATEFCDYNASWVSGGKQSSVQAGDKVHLLIKKMMRDNHVNVVGEGLVGRVAFTGSHQWILSENYYKESHPPEVLKEVCKQFSAGMQTVAAIPVLPYGVVQFGSFLAIMENMGFVSEVTSLVLQLGYVSGALITEDYSTNGQATKSVIPLCVENSMSGGASLDSNVVNAFCPFGSSNYIRYSGHTSMVDGQTSFPSVRVIENEQLSNVAAFQSSNSTLSPCSPQLYHQEAKIAPPVKFNFSSSNQVMNGVAKAEVILSNSEMLLNQNASLNNPRSSLCLPSSSTSTLNHGLMRCTEQKKLSDTGNQSYVSTLNASASILMAAGSKNSGLIYRSNDGSASRASVEAHELPSNMKPLSGIDSVPNVKQAANGNITPEQPTSSELDNATNMGASKSDLIDHLTTNSFLAFSSGSKYHHHLANKFTQSELNASKEKIEQDKSQAHDIPLSQYNEHLNMTEFPPGFVEDDNEHVFGSQIPSVNDTKCDDACTQPEPGNDLFDVLGADFKNKLLSSYWNSCLNNESGTKMHNRDRDSLPSKKSLSCSRIYSTSQENSESGMILAATDNLLEAVVSKVCPPAKRSLDDTVSCMTTLTSMSSSSAANTSLPYDCFGASAFSKGELFGVPKYLANAGAMNSCSFRTGSSKEESGIYSWGSSIYGSQISSWIEKDQKGKQNNSVSTGYSKKRDEISKPNRKRLKPGENPRPRPKDRQMIQDRVKELREIVPSGAKCSIDALLERTIKHMLFLQSVMKHADKLKQNGESKIFSKDGGLLSQDNFEGGVTWAYEVGSESLVCPIIVENLNQPRQMLVEMLCEERGFFLEIADIIRGLGLTILNGVMETRNNKIWARFAVEANRDVTRMEIFISLVRLLEPSAKDGDVRPNGISCENLMA